ncbi:hypothetical protein CAEBREN_20180 [Caenorhabditis brenneri]|uniref:Uncharacterized protein n=1 Tax=Caenorhabditis brenneri TaxID=135651 RepID=G0NT95_CAEBE|nr:hypothetical protein CAEBREN_20180 [Caenorhabditis brenneri]
MSQTSHTASRPTIFHRDTANYISQFFQSYKLPSSAVNHIMFKRLCQHLNPLVLLPSVHKLESLKSNVFSHQPCSICGIDDQNQFSCLLDVDDAAMFLSVAVLTQQKMISQAKRDILNENLAICVDHIRILHGAMMKLIGISSKTSFDDLPEYNFLGARAVYNNLIGKKRLKHRLPVPEAESMPSIGSEKNLDNNEEQAPKELKLEEPDLEKVKIEEPDYEEQTSSDTHTVPSALPSTSSSFPSLIPSNSTVYTLKNGKKVVKAPANLTTSALASSSGKLVVYRVAKRKVFKRHQESDARNPEHSQAVNRTGSYREDTRLDAEIDRRVRTMHYHTISNDHNVSAHLLGKGFKNVDLHFIFLLNTYSIENKS